MPADQSLQAANAARGAEYLSLRADDVITILDKRYITDLSVALLKLFLTYVFFLTCYIDTPVQVWRRPRYVAGSGGCWYGGLLQSARSRALH